MTLGSTQPLTEMSTTDLPGGKERQVRKADNLTVNHLENVGTSTSHNTVVLHGLLQGCLYIITFQLYSSVSRGLIKMEGDL
jgi:hypothetical protein